jgi:hypothetical protein
MSGDVATRLPVTLLARSTRAVESTPAVAFKKPVSDVATVPRFGALDSVPIEEVALMRASAREEVK